MKIVSREDLKRLKRAGAETEEPLSAVQEIIDLVRKKGDEALRTFTLQFDGADVQKWEVGPEEMEEAMEQADPALVRGLTEAARRIRKFHEHQRQQSWFFTEEDGTVLGQKVVPLEKVGVYVPGGKAAYPSSVLMNVIPAKTAGVDEVIMVTPPLENGKVYETTLVAAKIAGADRIFRVGGAQAVAALAYGTESIPRVDKIVGPGNVYVALAKRAVFGQVDIDSIAGPSEIVVLADESADPVYVAADLLSQAEHDRMASAVCITPSRDLAERVAEEVERQCRRLPRREIAEASIKSFGAVCLVKDMEEAVSTANQLAPEHLELMVRDPWHWLAKIKHAGAVFLGEHSPEPVGDYWAGPNHVLPTSGTARFFSPLSVDQFVKKTSVISYSPEALYRDGDKVMYLAEAEGLTAHAESVRVRLTKKREGEGIGENRETDE
ncbi:histidinol dehydrogenase [Thermoactinomyces intermedius]|uniref:Histidinol dehydrogenase n=1 Tax=Thermoactinomyces intermedius TaxID=2024 RepID=A0A8I1ADE2_THEIN|nr:histidinol dehydrogenase [Thermoactinomyces intermedius]MBA4548246.1 histidinol dehydrogenase [Thermoactinomyces intermedius]MBA4835190.1 histidinol dehydrogenase [Thermoactinomyces intermedius]MBH8595090.1 histidinol dehydrogenase [Thermoactinomyces intermedius]MBH8600253.1 histidinol dehydrogenase [Thermoactinomyces sp. CICC 23799]